MCAIRQIVPVQRLYEVLLEPGDGVRYLAGWGPGDDQVPKVRAMRTGQRADGDFLLDQRGESRNQGRLVEGSSCPVAKFAGQLLPTRVRKAGRESAFVNTQSLDRRQQVFGREF